MGSSFFFVGEGGEDLDSVKEILNPLKGGEGDKNQLVSSGQHNIIFAWMKYVFFFLKFFHNYSINIYIIFVT